MSDAALREEERLVRSGATSPERLEHARCRAGQHCACPRNFAQQDPEVIYRGVDVWDPVTETFQFAIERAEIIIHFHRPARGLVNAVEERVQDFLAAAGLLPARSPSDGPLAFACPSCGVEPGTPCVTASGRAAKRVHQPRINTPERICTEFATPDYDWGNH